MRGRGRHPGVAAPAAPRTRSLARPGPHVLVTGFEPYLGPVNATERLVTSLATAPPDAWRAAGLTVSTRIFPVRTHLLAAALRAALAEVRPDACVFFGQAPGLARIDVEMVAANLLDFKAPDVDGVLLRGQAIEPGGPPHRRTSWRDPARVVARLWRAGIPAALSRDAGRYLCNQLLYLGLAEAGVPAGFIHVPLLPEQAGPGVASMRLATTRAAAARIVDEVAWGLTG